MVVHSLFDKRRRDAIRQKLAQGKTLAAAKPRQDEPLAEKRMPGPQERAEANARLLNAAKSGVIDAVEKAIAGGAGIDTLNQDGRTALMEACARGHTDIVMLLISKGANKEMRDNDGHTALMFACFSGVNGPVDHLVNAGANVNSRNHNDRTALSIALSNDDVSTVALLRRHGATE